MKSIRSFVHVVLMFGALLSAAFTAACWDFGPIETEDGDSEGSGGGDTETEEVCIPDTDFDVNDLPCDIFEAACAPCVSAHSSVRVLRAEYTGPLYQICKGEYQPGPNSCLGDTLDIGAVDGFADVAAHEAYCTAAQCTISKLYDQAAHDGNEANDLEPAPPGGAKKTPGEPVYASDLSVTLNGRSAYGMLFMPGQGYRAGCTGCNLPKGIDLATGDTPQTIYMITSQHDLYNGCCFDYGNAETTCNNDGEGTMETVYFGGGVIWGTGSGSEVGPWVMIDLENGLFAGWDSELQSDQGISTNTPLAYDFVTAIAVGDTAEKNNGKGRFALYGGDAQNGGLTEMYDGIRPERDGYNPMRKQGSLILGIGGDNSDGDGGRFYEGAMVNKPLTREVLDNLQAAIVAAGYGK